MEMLFYLLVGHAVCDYPLQGDFLARGKNHTNPIPGIPWWQCLFAHSLIHGGAVALITGVWWLGLAEALIHAWIDFKKCSGIIGFNEDQFAHVVCKIGWWLIATFLVTKLAS